MKVMTLSYGPPHYVKPPTVGPLAESGTGRLTRRGNVALAAFVKRFPDGLRCLALAAADTRRNAKKYERLFGRDELETLCLHAAVAAVRRWRPSSGALTTAFVWAARSELKTHFRPVRMPVVLVKSPMPRTRDSVGRPHDSPLLNAPSRIEAEALADPHEADLEEIIALAKTPRDGVKGRPLTEREEDVVRQHFGLERTLNEIAGEYGINKERVRQIGKAALKKLREAADRRKF